jgi:WD40 repeat protein
MEARMVTLLAVSIALAGVGWTLPPVSPEANAQPREIKYSSHAQLAGYGVQLVFTPRDATLLVAVEDQDKPSFVSVRNAKTLREQKRLKELTYPLVAISNDAIITGTKSGHNRLAIVRPPDWRLLRRLPASGRLVSASHDGNTFAVVEQTDPPHASVAVYPGTHLRLIKRLHVSPNTTIHGVALSHDGRYCATALMEHRRTGERVSLRYFVRVYDARTWRATSEIGDQRGIQELEFNPVDNTLAVGDGSEVSLWPLPSSERKHVLQVDARINDLAFSRDGRLLTVATYAWDLGVWDVDSGRRRFTLEGDGSEFIAAVFRQGNNGIAATTAKGSLLTWTWVSEAGGR